MPNTKTISSNAVVEFWAALVSARLEEGDDLEAALARSGATLARFGRLEREADKQTLRIRR